MPILFFSPEKKGGLVIVVGNLIQRAIDDAWHSSRHGNINVTLL